MAEEIKGSYALDESVAHSHHESHLEPESAHDHASSDTNVVEGTTTQLQAPTSPLRSLNLPLLPLTHSPPSSSPTTSRASSPAPTFDFTSLQTSKHATSFTIRNQAKLLRLHTRLSDLHLHVTSAYRTEDQILFNDVYTRIFKAGEGLRSFAKPVVWKKRDAASRKLELSEMRDVAGCMDDGSYYLVQHGRMEDEGSEYEKLCGERVRRARENYDARWRSRGEGREGEDCDESDEGNGGVKVEGEPEGEDHTDGGVKIDASTEGDEDEQTDKAALEHDEDESQETTAHITSQSSEEEDSDDSTPMCSNISSATLDGENSVCVIPSHSHAES